MNAPILSKSGENAFALYLTATASSERFLWLFNKVLQSQRMELKREKKRLFNDLQAEIKRLQYKYDQVCEFSMGLGLDNNAEAAGNFDALLYDSNMICAFLIALYNATAGKPERVSEILDYLKGLDNDNAPFPQEWVEEFAKRCKV